MALRLPRLLNQQDPAWCAHGLGWGPGLGTIGAYGCYDTVCAMIAWLFGLKYTPSAFDVLATVRKIFVKDPTGTFDFLPDNALDLAFPGHFKTTSEPGYNGGRIDAAIKAPDEAAYLHVAGYSPYWGMNILTHYIGPMTTSTSFADPEGGVVRSIAAYGGVGNVLRTYIVKFLDPSLKAAAEAVAAAAAKAKAAADAAAITKTAAAQAAAAQAAKEAAAAQAAAAAIAAQAAAALATKPDSPITLPTCLSTHPTSKPKGCVFMPVVGLLSGH